MSVWFADVTWTSDGSRVVDGVYSSAAEKKSDKTFGLSSFLTIKPSEWISDRVFTCKATEQVEAACSEEDKSAKAESAKQANATLLEALATAEVVKAFNEWEAQKAQNAMFRSIMNYLHRVETVLFFVAASRNADLALHLEAAEALSKLFFAFDRMKYKRLWPRYIADMHDLRTNHPETWKELEAGNLSVTRNDIPFVSIGADHACEHLNKQMKVHSGLIGISNNANARQRFFMATPELSCLSREFKSQFGIGTAGKNT
ncbi:hypothetical protein SKAU_G00289400 [Synaphobranchus kaupii]|uniref:Immunoglobulin C1-set domain-containing protein n=1 Tax=Synaphobranchus kaupii TaxID=118154 RepID=A0A9Q1ETG1_SYNKA|nr:hypothetical protein SKAU_G00289400 [Synaphobranchus kaupii]